MSKLVENCFRRLVSVYIFIMIMVIYISQGSECSECSDAVKVWWYVQ